MRANQKQWQYRPVQQKTNMPNTPQVNPSAAQPRNPETDVMRLARKIKTEQGEKTAGHFLYAMRPYTAPGEISHIESTLNLHAERDPAQAKPSGGNSQMNMLQLLMRLMQGGSKPDPMTLMKMMSG